MVWRKLDYVFRCCIRRNITCSEAGGCWRCRARLCCVCLLHVHTAPPGRHLGSLTCMWKWPPKLHGKLRCRLLSDGLGELVRGALQTELAVKVANRGDWSEFNNSFPGPIAGLNLMSNNILKPGDIVCICLTGNPVLTDRLSKVRKLFSGKKTCQKVQWVVFLF